MVEKETFASGWRVRNEKVDIQPSDAEEVSGSQDSTPPSGVRWHRAEEVGTQPIVKRDVCFSIRFIFFLAPTKRQKFGLFPD